MKLPDWDPCPVCHSPQPEAPWYMCGTKLVIRDALRAHANVKRPYLPPWDDNDLPEEG